MTYTHRPLFHWMTAACLLSSLLFAPFLVVRAQVSDEILTEEPVVSLPETATDLEDSRPLSYTALMRRFHALRTQDQDTVEDAERTALRDDLAAFLEQEKIKTGGLPVSQEKQRAYIDRLEAMIQILTPQETPEESWWNRFVRTITEWFHEDTALTFDGKEFRAPDFPSQFQFADDVIEVKELKNPVVRVAEGETITDALKKLVRIEVASADTTLPVLADIKPDGEAVIPEEIRTLAKDLDNNPVAIMNYVQNAIQYEPYFGAKKGSVGCLHEKACNDVDASSLTIALLRAAGIPARYKTSIAVFSMDQLKSLLGVDEANTVYAAFASNHVPVYTISGNPLPEKLDDANLSGETHLALEWVFAEAFYDYDERGANIPNTLEAGGAQTSEELHALLAPFPKKQWIPIDVIVRSYIHTKNPILAESANFNAESFFYDYLAYQGNLDPVEKYAEELKTKTGKTLESSLSTKGYTEKSLDIIPITLPYLLGEGSAEDGSVVAPEAFSILPESFRYQLTLSLLQSFTNESVLETTFLASVVNNAELNVYYEGFTPEDQAIIDSYGGIHLTPAELVDIRAMLRTEDAIFSGTKAIAIGESLVMKFRLTLNGEELHIDEKFSTAGNHEGVYLAFSKTIPHPFLIDDNDPDKNSKILLEGNTAVAREYLRTIEKQGALLKQSLDYEYQTLVTRAVVTQNRILNTANGVPTTFDFQGLTIDATTFVADYSNRGNYKNHRKDFRLLWGLMASYEEGQVFTDLAGLNGISTVKGLQYAYGNPGTYTIHIITSANKAVIDTLTLSENTKENMKADVDKGNTVITPQKAIEKGKWKGVLYISLDPTWTGTYAIGEQVSQNGGFTTDDLEVASVYDPEVASWIDYYFKTIQLLSENAKFGYQDMPKSIGSVACTLKETTFNAIKSESGWKTEYGFPCRKDIISFGPVEHIYILATNAIKFYRTGQYNYWTKPANVLQKIDKYIEENTAISSQDIQGNKDLGLIKMGNDFTTYGVSFSTILGTYKTGACENQNLTYCPDDEESVVYYSPNGNGGDVFRVIGELLEKLDVQKNGIPKYAVKQVGFPVSHEAYAGTSPIGTQGTYQNFVNGQLYKQTNASKSVAYVPQAIVNVFNGENGTWGKLGFPSGDPYSWKGTLAQDFETGRIEGWGSGYAVSPIWYSQKDSHHFLIVNLNPNASKRACFKSYIGLADGVSIGDKNVDGTLKKQFSARHFGDILFSTVASVIANRKLSGYEPVAGINADFVDNSAPMGINFSLGHDYTGWRDFWTAMGISKNNEVIFSGDKGVVEEKYKHAIVGGGPKIITKGEMTKTSCSDLIGFANCNIAHDQRTAVGITGQNFMIVLVTDDGPFDDLPSILNTYEKSYGKVKEANMFDGGGSPSLIFENGIKREGGNTLSSLLLMYSGDACANL